MSTNAHGFLLEHYYSKDFPWQFDRKMTKPLITWWLEKKVVKWQKFKSALCNLTQKLLLLNFVSMQFLTEISNQSGSQIHSWILLKKKIYCIRIYSIFFRASPFHSEWLPLINILMIETFSPKANQNLSRLWPIEVIHGEKDLPCKKLNKFWYNIIFFQEDSSMDLASKMIWRFGCPMKLDTISFSVKSQSSLLHFCHLTSFAKETTEINFSVKS